MNALFVNIHLLEPVLIAEVHGGDPNSAVGLSYIPGSTLRGALIVRYQRQHRLDDLANDDTARRLFFDGSVRYLNAYPLTEGRQRMLPTPLSWYVQKDSEDEVQKSIYDFAVNKPDQKELDQPKPVHGAKPFCSLNDGGVQLSKPERAINIHIYRAKRNEQSDDNTLFRYEALAPNQMLQSIILADDPADLEAVRGLLSPPDLSLGKSRRAGYGRVTVEVSQADWGGEYEPGDEDDQKIVVTCLSDVLVRDESGNYTCSLNYALGLEKHQAAFVQPHIIGGFNRTWGLPTPQVTAIQAGSVFVYNYNQNLLERLHQLAETGIGERLTEGFGRIAVNWQQAEQLETVEPSQQEKPLPEPLTGPSADLAQLISKRVLRNRLDAKLAVAINKLDFKGSTPKKAQLSRLRRIVYQAIREDKPDLISNHLKNLKETARKQFEKARVDNTPLNKRLEDLVNDPQSVWQIMGVQQMNGPEIGQQQAKRDDKLADEYTLRLINGILRKAAKEAKHE